MIIVLRELMKNIFKVFRYGSLLAASIAGSYQAYEQFHLSSDLKRTLTAACDPAATENDIDVYIRTSRLQVRTRKDATLLKKLTDGLIAVKSSNALNYQLEVDAYFAMKHKMEAQFGPSTGANDRKELSPSEIQAAVNQAKSGEDTAKKLYKEIRSELGLPPV